MSTPASRQKAFRARMRDQGLVQVTIWVHSHQQAELTAACDLLRKNPRLAVGPLRDTITMKLVSSR